MAGKKVRPKPPPSGLEFSKCPGGHKLPHPTPFGQCTPLYCPLAERPEQPVRSGPKTKVQQEVEKHFTAIEKADQKPPSDAQTEARVAELTRLVKGGARLSALMEFYGVDKNLTGKAAEEFFDKRIIDLLPKALLAIEDDLDNGSPERRSQAVQRILDATGRGKTERGGVGPPPIVIVAANGMVTTPWSTRTQTVDVSPSLPGGADGTPEK